jgi:nucleoside-diphosphate-sugar epimerase
MLCLGLVGGDIVLQLLQRGESPESIRVVDFVPLNRRDMFEKAAGCDFVKADIASRSSVDAAFSKPWPASVAKKPLTVFHTAAAVRPQERSPLLYHRISGVNRDGAVNVLEAARAAGADILVATSSASVSLVPPKFWIWPWQSITNYFQVVDEKDFDAPLRPHHLFFSNCRFCHAPYSHPKVEN